MSDEGRYANTLHGYIERVATTLGDYAEGREHQTYPYDYLRALICDAFVTLSEVKPDLFPAQEYEFELPTEEPRFEIPAECGKFLEFIAVVDQNKRTVPIYEGDYREIERAASFPSKIPGSRGDAMSTVPAYNAAMHPEARNVAVISPMAPPGCQVKIRLLCRNMDKVTGRAADVELPDKLRSCGPMVTYLVQSMVLSKDDPTLAAAHFQSFAGLAQLSLQQREVLRREVEARDP